MNNHPFAAARLFGVPLAIHPLKGKVIAQAIAARFNITSIEFDRARMMEDDGLCMDGPAEPETGYDAVCGIAVSPVEGTLVHKSSSLRPYSGMLGYNAIKQNFLTALEDDSVRAIVLNCNSPGGEVSGCFDLVDLIYNSRGRKPIWAILDDMAYSACYAIASAADFRTVPRTGGGGSVGVITMHADVSKMLKGQGIDVTIFQYGNQKSDGNEFNPLSSEVKDRIQVDIDTMGRLFDATVGRNLNMSPTKVKAAQAGSFMGAACVDVGFADAVMAPDDAFRSLLAELG